MARRAERDSPLELVDDLSKRIIAQLQRDGRRSYAAIAHETGLSEAAVRQRVRKLVESRVMQIVAVVNPLALGLARMAMIGIKADGDLREVAAELALIEQVDYVVLCAGSFDILVELLCEDNEHLLSLVNDRIRVIPGVRSAEIFPYLRIVKESYQTIVR
jgi:Lrp/AsnC family transcriptional regulator, regulator for asnA, asnC and gidA